jgi:hypothetical protein
MSGNVPDTERWLPVVGYEGYYEVSDHGRVRSVDRLVSYSGSGRARGYTRTVRGSVLRPGINPAGYLHVNLYKEGQPTSADVHTLVLSAFVGAAGIGMECRHKDGNTANNHYANLQWGTSSENKHDVVRHGHHHLRNRTTCPRGHPLVAPNLIPSSLVHDARSCLACSRARAKATHVRVSGRILLLKLQPLSDQYYAQIMAEHEG